MPTNTSIEEFLKHFSKDPTLLDRAELLAQKNTILGFKYINLNNALLNKQTNKVPYYPEKYIIEATARLCAIILKPHHSDINHVPKHVYLTHRQHFTSTIHPRDIICITVQKLEAKKHRAKFTATIDIQEGTIGTATLTVTLIPQ